MEAPPSPRPLSSASVEPPNIFRIQQLIQKEEIPAVTPSAPSAAPQPGFGLRSMPSSPSRSSSLSSSSSSNNNAQPANASGAPRSRTLQYTLTVASVSPSSPSPSASSLNSISSKPPTSATSARLARRNSFGSNSISSPSLPSPTPSSPSLFSTPQPQRGNTQSPSRSAFVLSSSDSVTRTPASFIANGFIGTPTSAARSAPASPQVTPSSDSMTRTLLTENEFLRSENESLKKRVDEQSRLLKESDRLADSLKLKHDTEIEDLHRLKQQEHESLRARLESLSKDQSALRATLDIAQRERDSAVQNAARDSAEERERLKLEMRKLEASLLEARAERMTIQSIAETKSSQLLVRQKESIAQMERRIGDLELSLMRKNTELQNMKDDLLRKEANTQEMAMLTMSHHSEMESLHRLILQSAQLERIIHSSENVHKTSNRLGDDLSKLAETGRNLRAEAEYIFELLQHAQKELPDVSGLSELATKIHHSAKPSHALTPKVQQALVQREEDLSSQLQQLSHEIAKARTELQHVGQEVTFGATKNAVVEKTVPALVGQEKKKQLEQATTIPSAMLVLALAAIAISIALQM